MTERTLVLLRHAKAQPSTGADIERPLTARGHADAAAAGAWLLRRGHLPELVICSPAKRTRQTWHGVAVALAETGRPRVRYEAAMYAGGVQALLDLARSVDDTVGAVLLIGHNPTISQLSSKLDPDGGIDSDGLRTCGIAVHAVTGSWSQREPARILTAHTARA